MEKVLTSSQKYYQKNRDAIIEKSKLTYNQNKEHVLKQKKEYYKKNREVKIEWQKNYYKCPIKQKHNIIGGWKRSGLITDDYDTIYDTYINTNNCEKCDCDITRGRGLIGKKHLDHDHESGEFRNILCGKCNINLKDI
tara:strand:- start:35 stop:448 length:414 start_codon:yes stop_codon:yes gene_type:complete